MRPVRLALPALCLAGIAAAQEAAPARPLRIVVVDSLAQRVPYAWVQLNSGVARTTDDSGRVAFDGIPADSVRILARRMGYTPFDGMARLDPALNAYRVQLDPTARTLERVKVIAPGELRLVRAGFYSRMEAKAKIPSASRFIGPEELENRNTQRTSSLLELTGWFRMEYKRGKVLVHGRGGCPVNVVMDGRRPRWMSGDGTPGQDLRETLSLDELVNPNSIAAMEPYANASLAPDEFRSEIRNWTCGLVVIWTGPRQ